jgi:aconitate hydratase
MGVLPLQFPAGQSWETLELRGDERFDIDVPAVLEPQQEIALTIRRKDGSSETVRLLSRIDTPIEVDYFRHGGILPFVLRELLAA